MTVETSDSVPAPPTPPAPPPAAPAPPPKKLTRPPHPWLSIWISIAALVVAISSLGVSYFRSNNAPNTIVVTADVKKQLDTYYVECDDFYIRMIALRPDISAQDFKTLDDQIDAWSQGMGDFVQQRFGAAEKGRLLDLTGVLPFHTNGKYPAEIDAQRARLLFGLTVTKKNLALLLDRLKVK
jgi:hypothetical protein